MSRPKPKAAKRPPAPKREKQLLKPAQRYEVQCWLKATHFYLYDCQTHRTEPLKDREQALGIALQLDMTPGERRLVYACQGSEKVGGYWVGQVLVTAKLLKNVKLLEEEKVNK